MSNFDHLFCDIVDEDLLKRMDFIRKMGNNAAHSSRKITENQAVLCLENLQILLDFVCYCYADEYEEQAETYVPKPLYLSEYKTRKIQVRYIAKYGSVC